MNTTEPVRVVHLVDDDASILRLLQAMVATIGVDARPYASAQAFLSAYHPTAHECLVCDIRMPGIDGMLHISALSDKRVEKVTDVLKEGQKVRVKLMAIDDRGRLSLSMKPQDLEM